MSQSWMIVSTTTLLGMASVAAVAYWWRRRSRPRADRPARRSAAPAPDNAPLPVRDAEEALRITGGSLEVADMLLADLLGSLPDQLAAAADTLAREDWEALRALIHRIKGATAVCAVPALHHAVCELQQGARDNDARRVRSWLDSVERERRRLVAEQANPAGVWTTC